MNRSALLLVLLLSSACGDGDAEPSLDAGPANVDAGMISVAKGEACTADVECAEAQAKCRSGDICTGALDDHPFQQECARGGAEACPGLSCIGLRDNEQGKTGICTLPCEADADCGPSATCVDLGQKRCLETCTTDAQCVAGFVCVDNPMGSGRACLVTPL